MCEGARAYEARLLPVDRSGAEGGRVMVRVLRDFLLELHARAGSGLDELDDLVADRCGIHIPVGRDSNIAFMKLE